MRETSWKHITDTLTARCSSRVQSNSLYLKQHLVERVAKFSTTFTRQSLTLPVVLMPGSRGGFDKAFRRNNSSSEGCKIKTSFRDLRVIIVTVRLFNTAAGSVPTSSRKHQFSGRHECGWKCLTLLSDTVMCTRGEKLLKKN